MKSADREIMDRLAAEYVLGTLRGGARRHFERWFRSPQVRAMVHEWEDRLADLEPATEGVAPPPEAWEGIEQRLELRAIGRPPLLRRVALAAALVLLAAAGWLVFRP